MSKAPGRPVDEDGLRARGNEPSRIEAFSDVVFRLRGRNSDGLTGGAEDLQPTPRHGARLCSLRPLLLETPLDLDGRVRNFTLTVGPGSV